MRYILIGLILLSMCQRSYSQEDKKIQYRYLSFAADFGNIMPNTEFVNGDNLYGTPLTRYQSYSIQMLWQNPGYNHWQQVFRAPYYGFGLGLNNFFDKEELGYPVSVYGIFGMPIKRWNRWQLYSEFQFGMAVGWKHYDVDNNEYNLAIGSSFTVHVKGGINAFYKFNKRFDIGVGANFVHFSNGGMERPNRGINILSASVNVNYRLSPPVPEVIPNLIKVDDHKRSLLLMLGYGNHQLVEHELDTNYFAIGGISAIYLEQMSQAFRLGLGSDINYWWGLNANDDGTMAGMGFSNVTVGLILQPEMIIDRLTLVGGIGIYARHRNYGNFAQTYQRLGVRYDLYKNISLGVNVRAINFMLAEFMEFNLAYRIDWNK